MALRIETRKQPPSPFQALEQALDRESFVWLSDNLPDVTEGVMVAVRGDQSPSDVRRFIMLTAERKELAVRCESATR